MNKMFTLISFLSCLFLGQTASAMQGPAQQGIQTGTLRLHNTLNEPIDYQYSTILNGTISGITMRNSSISNRGTIAPKATQQLSSSTGFNFGAGDMWGNTISLSLKKRSQQQSQGFQIQQLGTYTIDQQGTNLRLTRE